MQNGNEQTSQQAAGNRQRNQRIQQNPETEHACIEEAHESTRMRLESTLPKDHEDHIAEKGFSSVSQYNLVHKLVPMPQVVKKSSKAAMDKEREKLEKLPALQLTKVESKKGGCAGSVQRAKNNPFCHADGHLSSRKNAELEPKVSEVQRPCRAPM